MVSHSTRVVMLDPDYGLAFMYHGEVSGAVWPSGGDLYVDVLMGRERPDAETRFRTQYLPGGPEFFVITDFRSMAEQPDLKAFLDRNFRILAEDYNYLVYDLRRWNGGP